MADWIAHISIIATGFGTVVGVLALLWAACAVIGYAFTRGSARTGTNPVSIPFDKVKAGIPPEHVAVISAAVAAVMEGPHRIAHITAPSHQPPGWSLEGRFERFSAQRTPWDRWPRVSTKSQRRKNR